MSDDVALGADVPHLLHAWRRATEAAGSAQRMVDMARRAARLAEEAREASEDAALAAAEALELAGVDVLSRRQDSIGQLDGAAASDGETARGSYPDLSP